MCASVSFGTVADEIIGRECIFPDLNTEFLYCISKCDSIISGGELTSGSFEKEANPPFSAGILVDSVVGVLGGLAARRSVDGKGDGRSGASWSSSIVSLDRRICRTCRVVAMLEIRCIRCL